MKDHDPAIVDLRRKIIAAIGESAPYVRTAEIDTLLAEFADGLIDRERDAARAVMLSAVRLGHNDDCLFCGFKDKKLCEALGPHAEAIARKEASEGGA